MKRATAVMKSVLLSAAALAASGCVIDARERDTVLEPVRTIDIAMTNGQTLDVRIPAAELTLRNSPDDRVRGELRVLCPSLNSHCAEKLADLDFVVEDEGNRVDLRLNHNNSWRFRNGSVEIDLAVPVGYALELDLTAEAVNAVVDNCVTADIEAGDVDFTIPIHRVGSVLLDAGVGDASLTIDGRYVSGDRSWLVGAEAEWRGGDGDCDVDIDLQAGDLRLDLITVEERAVTRLVDAAGD